MSIFDTRGDFGIYRQSCWPRPDFFFPETRPIIRKKKLSGRPKTGRREKWRQTITPAGTYVNGGELINLEFSFVLGNELDWKTSACLPVNYRAWWNIEKTFKVSCNAHDIARNDTNCSNLISPDCLLFKSDFCWTYHLESSSKDLIIECLKENIFFSFLSFLRIYIYTHISSHLFYFCLIKFVTLAYIA